MEEASPVSKAASNDEDEIVYGARWHISYVTEILEHIFEEDDFGFVPIDEEEVAEFIQMYYATQITKTGRDDWVFDDGEDEEYGQVHQVVIKSQIGDISFGILQPPGVTPTFFYAYTQEVLDAADKITMLFFEEMGDGCNFEVFFGVDEQCVRMEDQLNSCQFKH